MVPFSCRCFPHSWRSTKGARQKSVDFLQQEEEEDRTREEWNKNKEKDKGWRVLLL